MKAMASLANEIPFEQALSTSRFPSGKHLARETTKSRTLDALAFSNSITVVQVKIR